MFSPLSSAFAHPLLGSPCSTSLLLKQNLSLQISRMHHRHTNTSRNLKKKQSDVLRFLQRVRVWEYRQLPSVCRVSRPTRPDKARGRLQGKTRILHLRLKLASGGRKRPVSKVHLQCFEFAVYPIFPKSTVSERTDESDAWANHQQLLPPPPKINRVSVMASRPSRR